MDFGSVFKTIMTITIYYILFVTIYQISLDQIRLDSTETDIDVDIDQIYPPEFPENHFFVKASLPTANKWQGLC